MSDAFKCDICGEFRNGNPSVIRFLPSRNYFSDNAVDHDVCGMCKIRVIETFKEIAREHNFVNDYNCKENELALEIGEKNE